MRNLQRVLLVTILLTFFLGSPGFADTFINRRTGEILHGYATSKTIGGKTIVRALEKQELRLSLAQWKITADRMGRNNRVVIITLDKEIMLDIETQAIEQAITKAADTGPLCIIFEIDTPGGRTDYAKRICSAVTGTGTCEVVAFIKGGQFGGALSAGAALALSCDQIYMANNSVIGAAAVMSLSDTGMKDFKETFGAEIGEKISSAWRAYLASLAQQNHRPGLLARAMVDKDIEVVEVAGADERFFIDPVNKGKNQRLVHTWSKKGSLLTLTAEEAINCGIADKMVASREELLGDKAAADAEIVIDGHLEKAQREFRKVKIKYNKLRKSLDLQIKEFKCADQLPHVLKLLRGIRADFKSLIRLAKNYPDLNLSVEALEEELNSVEAYYKNLKMQSRRRR